jgi:hypothetical protein
MRCLLVGLTLVDVGCVGLRQNRQGEGGKNRDQQSGCTFHLLLLVFGMGQPHAQNNASANVALTGEM